MVALCGCGSGERQQATRRHPPCGPPRSRTKVPSFGTIAPARDTP
jgi:hypothetical protein